MGKVDYLVMKHFEEKPRVFFAVNEQKADENAVMVEGSV